MTQRDLKQTYYVLPVADVMENDWNPNHMEAKEFNLLKAHIQKVGDNSEQPIMVRKHPEHIGKYQIIDGAHRYKVMKELGFEEIIATIVDYDDKMAKIKTLSMNKIKGEADQVKLAELIKDLRENHNVADTELEQYLGYSADDLDVLASVTDYDVDSLPDDHFPDELLNETEKLADEEFTAETLTLDVTPNEREVIEKVKKWIGLETGSAVAVACLYLTKQIENGTLDSDSLRELIDELNDGEKPYEIE